MFVVFISIIKSHRITAIIRQTLLKYTFSSYFSNTVKKKKTSNNLQNVNIILIILHTIN